jgi:hypothetical protein
LVDEVVRMNDNVNITGYMQSFHYFWPFRAYLRTALRRFDTALRDAAERNLHAALKDFELNGLNAGSDGNQVDAVSNHSSKRAIFSRKRVEPVFVGVHVRRGDIVESAHSVKYGYEVATPAYLEHATTYYMERFAHVIFIVASNDMTWTRTYFPNVLPNAHVHFLNTVSNDTYDNVDAAHIDLATLSLCNHTIQTGTLSRIRIPVQFSVYSVFGSFLRITSLIFRLSSHIFLLFLHLNSG